MRPSARLFIRCRRGSFIPPPHRLSSMLYSPMYPQRPMPEIPEGKYKESTEDDDFLSRHGGKVALVGFSFAMALVYRWFKGGSNKNELEAAIKGSFLVNPVEFSELRHNNSIGIDLYRAIIDDAHTFFPDHYASYADFIAFVQSKLEVAEVPPLAHAHILDRMILPSIEAGNAQATSHGIENDTTNADGKQWRVQMSADGRLPLHFLLVCFNAAVREKGETRISSLFRIAETISMGEIGEFSSELAQRGGGKCTEAQLKELIQSLQASYQVLLFYFNFIL